MVATACDVGTRTAFSNFMAAWFLYDRLYKVATTPVGEVFIPSALEKLHALWRLERIKRKLAAACTNSCPLKVLLRKCTLICDTAGWTAWTFCLPLLLSTARLRVSDKHVITCQSRGMINPQQPRSTHQSSSLLSRNKASRFTLHEVTVAGFLKTKSLATCHEAGNRQCPVRVHPTHRPEDTNVKSNLVKLTCYHLSLKWLMTKSCRCLL